MQRPRRSSSPARTEVDLDERDPYGRPKQSPFATIVGCLDARQLIEIFPGELMEHKRIETRNLSDDVKSSQYINQVKKKTYYPDYECCVKSPLKKQVNTNI